MTTPSCDDCSALTWLSIRPLDAEGPIVGSGESSKANPAAVELRQHRIVLARLIAALRIPLDDTAGRTQARPTRGVYGIAGSVS